MSLTMKRYWYLILIGILFLWVLVYLWSNRVISINIGEKWNITTWLFDIDNTIDLFDVTQVHEVNILMSEENYKSMLDTYSETSEKERFKTDVIIDWVTIHDVWVRLKWNSTLWWFGGWWWPGWDMDENFKKMFENMSGDMENFMNWDFDPSQMPNMWNMSDMWNMPNMPWNRWNNKNGKQMDFGWKNMWDFKWGRTLSTWSNLPLLLKFDEFVNQTYQWHEMVSIRLWGGMWRSQSSWQTFLEEPYSYELYQEMWLPAPDSSYWVVEIGWKTWALYELSELPEDSFYIKKWFGDDNWVLYKAWNFVNFEYISEDPLDYTDSFTQKTRVNDYDMALLIKLLKFVTQSSDEEFEEKINDYIDVESVLTLLAIDDFVWNNDSFGWMWSNYYLYYHMWEQKFYMLTWDQNLALGGMWWMWRWINNEKFKMNNVEESEVSQWEDLKEVSFWTEGEEYKNNDSKWQNRKDFGWWRQNNFKWNMPDDFDWEMPNDLPADFSWDFKNNFQWNFSGDFKWGFWWWKWWFGMWNSLLKTRLMASEKYSKMYDEIVEKVRNTALNTDFSEIFFTQWTTTLLEYNEDNHIIDESIYLDNVESIKLRLK